MTFGTNGRGGGGLVTKKRPGKGSTKKKVWAIIAEW